MRAGLGAEFRHHAAGAVRPVADQRPSSGLQEDEAQQVAVAGAVQPAGEQPFRRCVPAARGPAAVQQIGRGGDRRQAGQHGRRQFVARRGVVFRVALAGKFEQIGAFCPAQPQRAGQPHQRGRRHRDVAALFDPGVPGRAEAAELRHFLPPQSRRAPPAAGRHAGRRGRQPVALRADEGAQGAPLFGGGHAEARGLCRRQNGVVNGPLDQRGGTCNPQLGPDLRRRIGRGPVTDAQIVGNLGQRLTLPQQAQHLAFAG